jgi:dTDP-L-rhamnose 4-epimerase
VVKANLLALEQDEANYGAFNVGGGKAWTVRDFYNTMQQIVKKTVDPIISGYYRYGDIRHIFSDTSSLAAIGWVPEHGIEDSIQSYWAYLNRQNDMEDILDYATKHMKHLQVIREVKST